MGAVRLAPMAALAAAALVLGSAGVAHGATFVVNNTSNDGDGSLRKAITDANGADPPPHVIDATAVSGTINLVSQLPIIAKDVTIEGPGADQLIVRRAATAPTDFRIFWVGFQVEMEISGLTVAHGRFSGSNDGGGGIFNDRGIVTIRSSVIRDNVNAGGSNGANGGGIANGGAGELTIIDSVVRDNTSNGSGGGIYIASHQGKVTVVNSTLSGNVTLGGAGCTGGGAIANHGALVVVNSTLSGNDGRRAGGAINTCSSQPTSVLIANSTLASNRAERGANLSVDRDGATGELRSTILAYPRGGGDNCFVDDPPTTLTSSGYNLADDDSCALVHATDQPPGTNPMLGSLADNGGPTQTRVLLPGSPAIDQGSAATGIVDFGTLTTDQRGLPRPIAIGTIPNAPGGDGSDIGALELQSLPPVPPPPPQPPDTEVTIEIRGKSLKVSRKGIAIARLACPAAEASGPCEGRLIVETRGQVPFKGKRRKVTLAKARFSVEAGEVGRVRLRLGKPKLRLVERDRRARRVRAAANVRDQAGNGDRVAKAMTLRVPRKRKG